MKKLMAYVVVLFLFTAFIGESHADYGNIYYGNNLVRWMQEYEKAIGGATDREAKFDDAGRFEGYVLGVYEASGNYGQIKYNVTAKTTVNQILAVVIKYLKAHPEIWHKSANYLVVEALADAFGTRDLLKNEQK